MICAQKSLWSTGAKWIWQNISRRAHPKSSICVRRCYFPHSKEKAKFCTLVLIKRSVLEGHQHVHDLKISSSNTFNLPKLIKHAKPLYSNRKEKPIFYHYAQKLQERKDLITQIHIHKPYI